jgi:hypothetical protein
MRFWGWVFPGFFALIGIGFGVAAWLADPGSEPRLTFWIMAASFLGPALLIAFIFWLIRRSFGRAMRLRRTGKQAWAEVVRVEDTGVTVNNDPRVHLWMKVQPHGGREFEVDGKRVVSRLSVPERGSRMLIRYDPADPSGFVFDDGSAGAPGAAVPGMEDTLRSALSAKGVTGARQEEAVQKALAAVAAGQTTIDLREYTRGTPAQEAEAEERADPVDQLERLAKLRDQGVISEGEFITAKTRLLSDL